MSDDELDADELRIVDWGAEMFRVRSVKVLEAEYEANPPHEESAFWLFTTILMIAHAREYRP